MDILPSIREFWRRIVPHVVVLFVVYHVCAVIIGMLPATGSVTRSSLKVPAVQQSMAAWYDALRNFGYAGDQQALTELAYRTVKAYGDARNEMQAPFRLYHRQLAGLQIWSLFSAANRMPSWLEIEIEEQGQWRTIYVTRSDEHAWQRPAFDDARLRKTMVWMQFPPGRHVREHFADWLRGEIPKHFPEATRVRVLLKRKRTPVPGAAPLSNNKPATYITVERRLQQQVAP